LQRSLHAVLAAMTQIKTLRQADDIASTLTVLAECHPALVLLDTSLFANEASALVRLIKVQEPGCRCLVLADDIPGQREAESAGANLALVKGLPAQKLLESIERLLTESHYGS
jgi:DNA-binding NarL/FixJ family response regulator